MSLLTWTLAALLVVQHHESTWSFCPSSSSLTKPARHVGRSRSGVLFVEPLSQSNCGCVSSSTAILLNSNARRVTSSLAALAATIVGQEHVFLTGSLEEARTAARRLCRSEYQVWVVVGGDGTVSGWLDVLVEAQQESSLMSVEEAVSRLPLLAYLPRGTGNGLGNVVGCHSYHQQQQYQQQQQQQQQQQRWRRMFTRRNIEDQEAKIVMLQLKELGDRIRNEQQQGRRKDDIRDDLSEQYCIVDLPLMEVDTHPSQDQLIMQQQTATTTNTSSVSSKGQLCFFAGAGFDSLLLHDFQKIQSWSNSKRHILPYFLKRALSSVAGYCIALVTLTLPQTLRFGTHEFHVRVTTKDDETLWVDHRRGDFSELATKRRKRNVTDNAYNQNGSNDAFLPSSSPSSLLYSGKTGILAASTTPYYGGGLRLFPYARLIPDKLHLRIGRISPLVGFWNIPKIFEGSYREKSGSGFGCLDFLGKEFEVEVTSTRNANPKRLIQQQPLKDRQIEKNTRDVKYRHASDYGNNGPASCEGRNVYTEERGFPFQHSGESMGRKERFRLRIVNEPVRFITFLQPRVIVDE